MSFLFSTKKYKKGFSDLDLESIYRIKLFQFNRHCSFISIKSNNKTISHTETDLNSGKIAQCMSIYGKIHLNTGENHSFYVNLLFP